MSEERGPRDRPDPPGDAAGRARGPMTAERNRLSRSESPGPRSKTRPTTAFAASPRSWLPHLIGSTDIRPERCVAPAGTTMSWDTTTSWDATVTHGLCTRW